MPELSITFQTPKTRIYGPGDTISGSAFFKPLFSARLRSLVITLQGYCYTSSLAANSKVSHSVPFLHLSTSTLEEKYTYVGERYEAPFSFTFPADTDVSYEAGPERLRNLFNQGPQLLPSSVVISARNCVQTVRYVIEVEIHGRKRAICEETVLFSQPTQSVKNEYVTEDLEIRSTQLLEEHQGQEEGQEQGKYNHGLESPTSPLLNDETWRSNKAMYYNSPQTIRLSDEEGATQLSLHALPMLSTPHKSTVDRYKHAKLQNRSSLQWVFKPWKTPKIVFMPSIYCPQEIAIGREIPLLLAIDTIKNPVWKGLGSDDLLILEEVSLAVTAHSRTIMQHRPHKRRWGRCLELSYAALEATGLSAPVSIDGVPTPIVQNFKILPGAIPSFATYTLSRGYSIDVFFKFRFGGEQLEWGASLNLNITADNTAQSAEGAHMDPLLFVDPKREPQYFWRSHIEAGAAESTSRSNIYPEHPEDIANAPGLQWETGHGRLPRTSFACASAQLRPELMPIKAAKGKAAALNIVAGVCGKPHRRYMKGLEPMVMPLFTFKHGLGLDGTQEPTTRGACLDGCGVLTSFTNSVATFMDSSFVS